VTSHSSFASLKPSGTPWLGDIPSHWEIKPLWAIFRPKKDTGHPKETLLSVYREYGVIKKSSRDDNKNRESEDLSGYQLVVNGDLVTNKMKAWQGSIAVSGLRGIVSPAYYVYRKQHTANDRYLHHLFRSAPYISGYRTVSKGIRVGQWDLEADKFRLFPVLIPPILEQESIIVHIDRVTAHIDTLVSKKVRFIELLRERRQALITRAVTKGLNDEVLMKNSSVKWLGEVPAHWVTCPIKYLGRIGNGSTPNRDNSHYWSETGFPWLNSSVVNQEEVIDAQQFVTDLALRECHLPIITPPAVLVGITGQGKTRGMAAPLMFKATINQHLAFIQPIESHLSTEFLLRALQMAYPHIRRESDGSGSTKGAITCEQLGCFPIPLPPPLEQKLIVEFLDRKMRRIDALIAKTERSIELLRERHAALITAAVTGKIDLREVA